MPEKPRVLNAGHWYMPVVEPTWADTDSFPKVCDGGNYTDISPYYTKGIVITLLQAQESTMARKPSPGKSKKRKAAKTKARKNKSRKVKPIPTGYHSVTPYLIVKGAAAALEFYKQAFGAREKLRMPDGERIGHAEIIIGNSHVMLADEYPERNFKAPQPDTRTPVGIMLYVPNVDAVFKRAVAAGASVERPLANQFYGDRTGGIIDPFGHRWYLATHIEDVSPKEMQRRMQETKK
jgi:PhnB protein